jgi:hypothetical protein
VTVGRERRAEAAVERRRQRELVALLDIDLVGERPDAAGGGLASADQLVDRMQL